MKRFICCVTLIAGACGLWSQVLYAANGSVATQTPVAAATSTNSADFVGAEVCASCHVEEAKKFSTNPHSRLALAHNGTGQTCESCHGPGKAHVEGGGDITKIKVPSKMTPAKIDATCLGCHVGAHPNFERSPHAKGGVSCLGCHSIHDSVPETKLLKAAQPGLCYSCHSDVKPAFAMPFHHKVDEGLLKCSDCHDVHGTFGNSNLKSTADQNAICTKCHTETRGPFVFEHAAIKGEGCLSCHTPHGSQNARLLNVPNVNQLCNQCHSPVAVGSVRGMHASSSDVTPCISCHTMIHGSNVNPAFIR